MNRKSKLTTEQFVSKAQEVHGDKYNYSKTVYAGRKKKISFICPEHGEISIIAGNHLQGHGCPKCGVSRRAKQRLSTTESFIKRATQVHHGKYDYSKTGYWYEVIETYWFNFNRVPRTPAPVLTTCFCLTLLLPLQPE